MQKVKEQDIVDIFMWGFTSFIMTVGLFIATLVFRKSVTCGLLLLFTTFTSAISAVISSGAIFKLSQRKKGPIGNGISKGLNFMTSSEYIPIAKKRLINPSHRSRASLVRILEAIRTVELIILAVTVTRMFLL